MSLQSILGHEKQEEKRSARDERQGSGEDYDSITDLMEEGLCLYMTQILTELFKAHSIINYNKTLNGAVKDKSIMGFESNQLVNVMLYDPWGEYKLVEKYEMEEQKRNENKIQNKDQQKPDNQDDKQSQKPASDNGNAAAIAKKKKPVFEDVLYNDIVC